MKKRKDPNTGAVIFEEEATLLDTKTPRPKMSRQQKRALAREAATQNIANDVNAMTQLTRRERRKLARTIGNQVAKGIE